MTNRGHLTPTIRLFLITLALSIAALACPEHGAAETDCAIRLPIKESNRSGAGAPAGWEVKEWKGSADVSVADTEIGKAIHLRSLATSTAVYRDVAFDASDHQVVSWTWKVTRLPVGADVRKKQTDDQAAQFYVIFPRWPAMVNSRVVGYIWETSTPEGTVVTSTKTSNTRYLVIKSGEKDLGRWIREERNVYEDYKMLFNEEPPQAGRISVMIDSDDTQSTAESFIGDICISRRGSR